jgi:hypothetical protein
MKITAFLLITLGTIGAAIAVARTDPSVEGYVGTWQINTPLTVLSLLVMGIGIGIQKRGERSAAAREGTATGRIEEVQKALDQLLQDVTRLNADMEKLDLDELYQGLDRVIADPVFRFVQNRGAISFLFGMGEYGRIMGSFAQAERYLNRAWSAAVDGYRDETVAYVQRALPPIKEAKEHFDKIR